MEIFDKEFKADINQHLKSDLQKDMEFKRDFGISPTDLTISLREWQEKEDKEWDDLIVEVTGHPNGHHPDSCHDIHINWRKVAECEAEGYLWHTMPWLPAPCERVGKSDRELNELAYKRRSQLNNNKRNN